PGLWAFGRGAKPLGSGAAGLAVHRRGLWLLGRGDAGHGHESFGHAPKRRAADWDYLPRVRAEKPHPLPGGSEPGRRGLFPRGDKNVTNGTSHNQLYILHLLGGSTMKVTFIYHSSYFVELDHCC